MAKGDPPANPWTYETHDSFVEFQADQAGNPHTVMLTIAIPWDPAAGATHDILDGTMVHRDPDCRFNRIYFDIPSRKKSLPLIPVGDTALTALQVRQATGFRTIEDVIAAGQITAEIV